MRGVFLFLGFLVFGSFVVKSFPLIFLLFFFFSFSFCVLGGDEVVLPFTVIVIVIINATAIAREIGSS